MRLIAIPEAVADKLATGRPTDGVTRILTAAIKIAGLDAWRMVTIRRAIRTASFHLDGDYDEETAALAEFDEDTLDRRMLACDAEMHLARARRRYYDNKRRT